LMLIRSSKTSCTSEALRSNLGVGQKGVTHTLRQALHRDGLLLKCD